jgi:16S rRNA (guanine527-N7)-methyltransferase
MINSIEQAAGTTVSRETSNKIARYAELLRKEAEHQNLIAASTSNELWNRHIIDSAQLYPLAPENARTWIDVGSGAGLPGIVLAALSEQSFTLCEPRRLRHEFLATVVEELALTNATVAAKRIEHVTGAFDVITARALAPLSKLLGITAHLSHPGTRWLLPKGRNAKSELAEAERSWHYEVRAEPSRTDADSHILLLSNVRAKRKS